MEAAKPILITPEEEEIQMKNIKEFEIKLNDINNELYKLEFAKSKDNSSIIFKIINNNILIKNY